MNDCVKKLPRLQKGLIVKKRPLLRPPIASPYASRQHGKTVYVCSNTPLISALKRVQKLLKQVDKRAMQIAADRSKTRTIEKGSLLSGSSFTHSAEPEPIAIKATGKAIDKALQIALILQKKEDCSIKINTSSVAAIDDITVKNFNSKNGQDDYNEVNEPFPESRVRSTSMIEILVTLH